MKELLDYISRALVDNPEEVSIEEAGDPNNLHLRIRVAPEDRGKIIGKQGRTARAIRTIITAAARKANIRAGFELVE
ncbi:MAG: hypothetical protein GMKNLPBB_00781 [Myxococcota bacterium]|nr:hypothetical protein [Myxococcota bacterium]